MPDPVERPSAPLPEHVTTPLLTLITQQSLDVDYQHVADRKIGFGPAPGRTTMRPASAIVLGLFGLMVALAGVQTARGSGAAEQSRASLISQIESRRDTVASLEQQISDLRRQSTTLAAAVDAADGQISGVAAEVVRRQVRTGYIPVHGEGVRITVDNGPASNGRVRASDLRLLTDGLWSAGAEAISINGHRITPLSAIGLSGQALTVNDQPVRAPYTVLVIGNNSELQARFADTTHGLQFYGLAGALGFEFSMQNERDLALAGLSMPDLRFARTPPTPDELERQGETATQAPSQTSDTTTKSVTKGAKR